MNVNIGEVQQVLMNSSVFGVYIHQDGGKIVFANERFARILGYSCPEELIGKNILDLIPENKEEFREIIKKRDRGEQFIVEDSEISLLSKYGALIPTVEFAYTIEYNGKPSGFVWVVDKAKEHSWAMSTFLCHPIFVY